MTQDTLELAKQHFSKASKLEYPDSFQASERWQHWSDMAASAIASFQSPPEAIAFAQQKTGFEHRTSVEKSFSHWRHYDQALLSDFPDQRALISQISDTKLSHPDTIAKFDGRLMSNMMFWHAYEFLATYTRTDGIKRIAEIGGGYGALARLWFLHGPRPLKYLMTDFPESLFFAEVYLREHFPKLVIRYVTKGGGVGNTDDADIVLCPAQLAASVDTDDLDLLINSGSMQEMTEAAMLWWCDWIENSSARFAYFLNYGLHPIHIRRGGSANWLCPRLGPYWNSKFLRLDPAVVKAQTIRHFREVLYERIPEADRDETERIQTARAILSAHDTPVSIHREQAALELVDALRLAPLPSLIMKLHEVLGIHYDYRPKELVHICHVGLNTPGLSEDDRSTLKNTLRDLMDIASEEHKDAIPLTPLF